MDCVRILGPFYLSRYNRDVLSATDVIAILHRFVPHKDGEAIKSRELTLALLAWSPAPFSRKSTRPVISPVPESFSVPSAGGCSWCITADSGAGCCRADIANLDPEISSVARREVIEETGAN